MRKDDENSKSSKSSTRTGVSYRKLSSDVRASKPHVHYEAEIKYIFLRLDATCKVEDRTKEANKDDKIIGCQHEKFSERSRSFDL